MRAGGASERGLCQGYLVEEVGKEMFGVDICLVVGRRQWQGIVSATGFRRGRIGRPLNVVTIGMKTPESCAQSGREACTEGWHFGTEQVCPGAADATACTVAEIGLEGRVHLRVPTVCGHLIGTFQGKPGSVSLQHVLPRIHGDELGILGPRRGQVTRQTIAFQAHRLELGQSRQFRGYHSRKRIS